MSFIFLGGLFHRYADATKIKDDLINGVSHKIVDLYEPNGDIHRYVLTEVRARHFGSDATLRFKAFFYSGLDINEGLKAARDGMTFFGIGPKSADVDWDVTLQIADQ